LLTSVHHLVLLNRHTQTGELPSPLKFSTGCFLSPTLPSGTILQYVLSLEAVVALSRGVLVGACVQFSTLRSCQQTSQVAATSISVANLQSLHGMTSLS
jgi:hypothetical protein